LDECRAKFAFLAFWPRYDRGPAVRTCRPAPSAPCLCGRPSLSRTIRTLEGRLGVRLLTRNTRSVAPTEAGERLVQAVGPHFAGIDEGLAALTEMREKPAGNLRITSVEHASDTILAPAVARPSRSTRTSGLNPKRLRPNGYCRRAVRCGRASWRTGRQGHDRPTDWAGLPPSSRRCAVLLRQTAPAIHAT
jgi:hypothetical protein